MATGSSPSPRACPGHDGDEVLRAFAWCPPRGPSIRETCLPIDFSNGPIYVGLCPGYFTLGTKGKIKDRALQKLLLSIRDLVYDHFGLVPPPCHAAGQSSSAASHTHHGHGEEKGGHEHDDNEPTTATTPSSEAAGGHGADTSELPPEGWDSRLDLVFMVADGIQAYNELACGRVLAKPGQTEHDVLRAAQAAAVKRYAGFSEVVSRTLGLSFLDDDHDTQTAVNAMRRKQCMWGPVRVRLCRWSTVDTPELLGAVQGLRQLHSRLLSQEAGSGAAGEQLVDKLQRAAEEYVGKRWRNAAAAPSPPAKAQQQPADGQQQSVAEARLWHSRGYILHELPLLLRGATVRGVRYPTLLHPVYKARPIREAEELKGSLSALIDYCFTSNSTDAREVRSICGVRPLEEEAPFYCVHLALAPPLGRPHPTSITTSASSDLRQALRVDKTKPVGGGGQALVARVAMALVAMGVLCLLPTGLPTRLLLAAALLLPVAGVLGVTLASRLIERASRWPHAHSEAAITGTAPGIMVDGGDAAAIFSDPDNVYLRRLHLALGQPPAYRVFFGHKPVLMLATPEAVRDIQAQPQSVDREKDLGLSWIFEAIMGEGIGFKPEAQRQRLFRAVAPAFHASVIQHQGLPAMHRVIADFFAQLGEGEDTSGRGGLTVDALSLLHYLPHRCLRRVLLGPAADALGPQLEQLIEEQDELIELIMGGGALLNHRAVRWLPCHRAEKARVSAYCQSWSSVFTQLIGLPDQHFVSADAIGPAEEGKVTMAEVSHTLAESLLGPSVGSAAALAWLLIALGLNPDRQEEMRRQILRLVAQQDGGKLSGDAELSVVLRVVEALGPAMDHLATECMRAYPLFPHNAPQQTTVPLTVAGHAIPAGTTLLLDVRSLNASVSSWGPTASLFMPSRHHRRPRNGMHGFGVGRRRCIGEAFMQHLTRVFLVHVLMHFRIEMASPEDAADFRAGRPIPVKRRGFIYVPQVDIKLSKVRKQGRDPCCGQ